MPKPTDGLCPGATSRDYAGLRDLSRFPAVAILRGDAFPAHPLDFSVKGEPSELMFAQERSGIGARINAVS